MTLLRPPFRVRQRFGALFVALLAVGCPSPRPASHTASCSTPARCAQRCRGGDTTACAARADIAAAEGASAVRNWLITACFSGAPSSCMRALRHMQDDRSFEDWELYDYVAERYQLLSEAGRDQGAD